MDVAISVNQSETGQSSLYQNWGGYAWRNDTPNWPPFGKPDIPAKNPKRPIIAEMKGNPIPVIVWYDPAIGFVSSNGAKWTTPVRWFYYRPVEEKLVDGSWVLPDGPMPNDNLVTLRAGDLDGMVFYMMSNHTVKNILATMDKYKGLNGPGAPNLRVLPPEPAQ